MAGRVVGIFVSPQASRPMQSVLEAEAIPGRGLKGDRYESGSGYYSKNESTPGSRELTLIDIAVLDDVKSEHGVELAPVETRRNIATSGVDLGQLLGMRFSLGTVVCEGVRDCPPCAHLDELVGRKVMKPLVRTGGLRARIVEGGSIHVGDDILEIGEAQGPFVKKGQE